MSAWDFLVLSAGNLHAHKIPRFRWGYCVFLGGGGASANFTFMGAGICLNYERKSLDTCTLLRLAIDTILGGGFPRPPITPQ